MKKLFTVLAVVFLFASVAAFAGTPLPGKYQGTITSLVPDQNGKTVTAEVKTEGTKTVANIIYFDNTKETWTWDGTTLTQQEFDNTGKVTMTYTASNVNGQYRINCTDRTKNVCDAQVDANAYWTINTTTPNSFTYTYFNITKNKTTNPNLTDPKRTEMVFNLAK